MITYKGRVVYEREKHFMTEKDVIRIMNSLTKDQSPAGLARALWGINVEFVELKVLSDEDLLAFAKEFLILILNWIGHAQNWLWDWLTSWLLQGD